MNHLQEQLNKRSDAAFEIAYRKLFQDFRKAFAGLIDTDYNRGVRMGTLKSDMWKTLHSMLFDLEHETTPTGSAADLAYMELRDLHREDYTRKFLDQMEKAQAMLSGGKDGNER